MEVEFPSFGGAWRAGAFFIRAKKRKGEMTMTPNNHSTGYVSFPWVSIRGECKFIPGKERKRNEEGEDTAQADPETQTPA